MRSWGKSFKKIFKKTVYALTVLAVIFSSLGPVFTAPVVKAVDINVSAIVNSFTTPGQTIKASSNATALFGYNLANGAAARTLDAARVIIAGPSGFNPNTDLAALANDATSGVALYKDGTATGGNTLEDGVFNPGSNGDALVALTSAVSVPAFNTSVRLSQLTPASTAVYTINGSSNTASPALAVGDMVYKHIGMGLGSWGVVTTALSVSTLSINGSAVANGAYSISKFGGGAGNTVSFTTGAGGPNPWGSVTGTYTSPVAGDIVLYQTGINPAQWGAVTVGGTQNQDTFAINGSLLPPATSFVMTKISSYTPSTSAVDGVTPGKLTGGLNFALGDLVIGNTGSSYVWGVVTTAENVTAGNTVSALRLNDGPSAPLFSVSTRVSKITASGTGLATAATPTLATGDAVFTNARLNAGIYDYNWHAVITGGAGGAASALRLDGYGASPYWPWSITLTPAAGISIPADNTTAGNVGADVYAAVKTGSSPTNGKKFAAFFVGNSDLTISGGDTVNIGSLPVVTSDITIDTTAPSAPNPADYQIMSAPPGSQDQIGVKQGVSVGTAGDTVKIYAADGTTLLGFGTLGGSPVQFGPPINIGDNANATVKVEFVDPAGNASSQATVTGNDIVAPTATATAYSDRIIIQFSEQVDGMMAMNCSNYTIGGSPLTCGGMGLPFVDFQGTKATIRGLSLSGTVNFSIPSNNTIKDFAQNPLTSYTDATMSVGTLVLPTIASITPSAGAVGDTITIAGTNFGALGGGTIGDSNHKVFFSGGFSQSTGPLPPIEAVYTGCTGACSWSDTAIVVKVPTGANGGPVNIMSGGVMSDMGPDTFFDIKGDYTASVYYGANNTSPMPDADKANIRIAIMGMRGPVVYSTDGSSGNTMSYTNGTPGIFTITGVASMGFTYAYDKSGTHLNSAGVQVNTSATQNLIMLATTRKISGTVTMGASCVSGGQDKDVVVMAMPDVVDTGSSGFKEVNPSFFRTGPANGQTACQTTYNVAIPVNGTYRVEAHIPPDAGAVLVGSSAYTDPSSLQVAITDSALTPTGKNFTFAAATHKIVGHVQKPSGAVSTTEGGMLWVFAYQPVENGKGTGTQVDSSGNFTLNVSPGAWKVGVGGPNMPFPVEVPIVVDDTFLISAYTAGTKTIVIAPPSDFIEGYVKDSAGNGLANASLYSWLEGGPGGGNAKTDSQGYYKMYVTPGSNYHIGANSQSFGFLGEQSGISVTGFTHPTVNFTVSSSNNYTISGTVRKGGQPLQQAFVFITDGQQGPMMGSGGTDAAGAYTVKVSGGANRWLHVGLPGKGELYLENLGTIGANNTSKDIAITSSTITVRISPPSSFSEAFVGVHSDQGGGFSNTDVSTNGAYREYQIDIPRSGSPVTYYVDGGIQGYGPITSVPVTVNSNGTFVETSGTANDGIIEITVSGLYTVSGTVSGSNVLDAWVWASGPNGGNGASVATNGSYTLKLKNGTYDIGVGKQDFIGNKISTTINGADIGSQDLTLTTAGQTITGTVYLPDGATAVTNAKIWASDGNGGFASASTDAGGAYTLKVGSGSWIIKAAYDGYSSSSIVVTAPAAGRNITLAVINGFVPNTKNQPIIPADGGTVQGTGIKVDFPKNALGLGTGAGTVQVQDTTNYTTNDATQIIGTAKEITARNDSNQTVTTITGSINVEITVSKAQLQSAGLTLDQAKKIQISSPSTSGAWTDIKTTATLSVPTAASLADLNSDPAITFTGTTSHLSTYALTQASVGAPPAPTGLNITAGDGSASLSWTASAGATKYDIYKKIGSDYPYLAQTTSTSYTATGLSNGAAYYFKVSALDASDKESAATSAVSVTPVASSVTSGGSASYYVAPTPTPTPTATPTPTVSPNPATSAAPSGVALYRAEGDSRVYVIKDGKKNWIKTAEEFIAAGYKWSDIIVTDSATVAAYPDNDSSSLSKVKVIGTPTLRVRQSNTTKSKAIANVKGDEAFTVLDQSKGWYKITTSGGVTGWISGAYAAIIGEANAPSGATITINASSLRVRSANSVSGKVLGAVREGEKYSLIDESSGWFKIKTSKGAIGWVSGAYATKE